MASLIPNAEHDSQDQRLALVLLSHSMVVTEESNGSAEKVYVATSQPSMFLAGSGELNLRYQGLLLLGRMSAAPARPLIPALLSVESPAIDTFRRLHGTLLIAFPGA